MRKVLCDCLWLVVMRAGVAVLRLEWGSWTTKSQTELFVGSRTVCNLEHLSARTDLFTRRVFPNFHPNAIAFHSLGWPAAGTITFPTPDGTPQRDFSNSFSGRFSALRVELLSSR